MATMETMNAGSKNEVDQVAAQIAERTSSSATWTSRDVTGAALLPSCD